LVRRRRRRFAGAELGSRESQIFLNPCRERVRCTEHAPRCRCQFLERRHGFAEIAARGGGVNAAVAEAEADEVGDSLDAAAVASSRRSSGRQHHQCRGRRCRRRQKKKHESA